MEVTSIVEINAPRARVFEVFNDYEHLADRIAGITKAVVHTDAPAHAGTSWTETRKMFGKEASETMTIGEFNPPASHTVLATSHGTKYVSYFTFEEIDGGTGAGAATRVTMRFTGEPQSFMGKIMGTIMNGMMRKTMGKMLDADMQDLKAFCEGGG